MIVLLFGPPGCGKGTQATLIANRYGIPAISTGEIFRAEIKAGTELGKKVAAILASGGLVGDDIVSEIVAGRLSQPDCAKGFLLDGYPRTAAQAQYLDGLLGRQRAPRPTAIFLDVPAEPLIARITARRQCPTCGKIYNVRSQPPRQEGLCDADGAALAQRADDQEDVIRRRLAAYDEQTGPVIAYYEKMGCHRLDGTQAPDEVAAAITKVLEAKAMAVAR